MASTNGHNNGASGRPSIKENYYLVDGEPKRLFDRTSGNRLSDEGWRKLSLEEQVINRYWMPKVV